MTIGSLMFMGGILIRKTHFGRKINIYFIFLQIITKTSYLILIIEYLIKPNLQKIYLTQINTYLSY